MIYKSSKRKYRRLMVFYSLVIIIPGTFLSILAYRGIQSNHIAEIKIRDDRLVRKSRYFIASIEETIKTYLDGFSDELVHNESPFMSVDTMADIDTLIDQGIVLGVIIQENDGTLKLLDQTTLFVPEGFWRRSNNKNNIIPGLIDGQSQEILHQSFQVAAERYAHILKSSQDPLFRLHALSGLARISIVQNNLRNAFQLYHQILEICWQPEMLHLIQSDFRMSYASFVEEMTMKQSAGSPLELQDVLALELLTFIGFPHMYLTENEYHMLYRRHAEQYNNGLAECLDDQFRKNCDSIFDLLKVKITWNSAFSNLFTSIENNLTRIQSGKRPRVSYVPRIHDTLSVVFSCKSIQHGSLGLLINISEVIKLNFGDLRDTISFPKRIAWRIIQNNSQEVLSQSDEFNEEKDYFRLQMYQFGSWDLDLQEVRSGRFEMLSEAGQMIYFLGFIFVIAAMAIGLLLAIRSLTSEYRLSILKSDFVSTVSHEFKSPLTSIRMMSERLAEQRVHSDERKQDYYHSMLNQSERLSHLVENILDFSRLDEGRKAFSFEPCEITRILAEVIEYLRIRQSDSNFKIDLKAGDEPIFGVVDSQGIHQVAFNLIDNAIKYSGESKRVEVNLEISDTDVVLSVRDFGIGITKKEKRRIFNRFYRSERVDFGSIKGSGIGLSIVNEIVKAHQGRIELESEVNKGSIFKVFLPLNKSKR